MYKKINFVIMWLWNIKDGIFFLINIKNVLLEIVDKVCLVIILYIDVLCICGFDLFVKDLRIVYDKVNLN